MANSTVTPDTATATRKPTARAIKPTPDPAADAAGAGGAGADAAGAGGSDAKAKFAKAIEEAKAGATALTTQVQDSAAAYRDKAKDHGEALLEEARAAAGQAKDKAAALAREGKVRAVEGIATVSRLVADNAAVIEDKLGAKYGDYARSAARSLDATATRLDAKDLGELGEDARAFVRNSPGLAIGLAAAAGFMLSRLFKGSAKSDD